MLAHPALERGVADLELVGVQHHDIGRREHLHLDPGDTGEGRLVEVGGEVQLIACRPDLFGQAEFIAGRTRRHGLRLPTMFSAAAGSGGACHHGPVACPPMDPDKPLFPRPPAATRVLCIGTALVDLLVHASMESVAALGLNAGAMTLIDDARAVVAIREALGVERLVSGGTVANTAAGLAALGAHPSYLGAVAAATSLGEAPSPPTSRRPECGRSSEFAAVAGEMGPGPATLVVTPDQERDDGDEPRRLGLRCTPDSSPTRTLHRRRQRSPTTSTATSSIFTPQRFIETILSRPPRGTRVASFRPRRPPPSAATARRCLPSSLAGRPALRQRGGGTALSGADPAGCPRLPRRRAASVVTRGAEGAVVGARRRARSRSRRCRSPRFAT